MATSSSPHLSSSLLPLKPIPSLLHTLTTTNFYNLTMKRYIKKIHKKLLKLKSSRSISRSDDPSFSSSGTSSDSSESHTVYKKAPGSGTPTSVLQKNSNEIQWMDNYITSDFVHAFQMMDRDGDGKIGKEELRILLSRVGGQVTEDEVKLMLTEIDKDGDGCISLEELSAIASALDTSPCGEELRETFDFFDADHDGNISAEELYAVFKTIVGDRGCTLDECRRMINGVDRNGDGFVCFEDFSRMMELQLRG